MDEFLCILIILFCVAPLVAYHIITTVIVKRRKNNSEDIFNEKYLYMTEKFGTISKVISDDTMSDENTVYVFKENKYMVIGFKLCMFADIFDVSISIVSPMLKSYSITLEDLNMESYDKFVTSIDYTSDASKFVVRIMTRSESNPIITYTTKKMSAVYELLSIVKVILDNRDRGND